MSQPVNDSVLLQHHFTALVENAKLLVNGWKFFDVVIKSSQ